LYNIPFHWNLRKHWNSEWILTLCILKVNGTYITILPYRVKRARTSLTILFHQSLSISARPSSSLVKLVSEHIWSTYDIFGRPLDHFPCWGSHRSSFEVFCSSLRHTCPRNRRRLSLTILVMEGRPYSCWLVILSLHKTFSAFLNSLV